MEFINQKEALQDLNRYADSHRQAILINGTEGCGKTYLAKQYSRILNIDDYQLVYPKIDNIRDTIQSCYDIANPVVVCIENMDLGVVGVSYAILKFLEEPKSNIYIVITCRNIRQVPDTIISRCVTIDVPPMVASDLQAYADIKYPSELKLVRQDEKLWRCVKSIPDMVKLSTLTPEQISYITSTVGLINLSTSVSNIVWKLQKFPDNTPTPIEVIVRYLMYSNSSWVHSCLDCLNALALGRLGSHAVLSRLVLELKYKR